MRNLKKWLKTQNPNGPIYLPPRDFPKKMHDLRDIDVFLRGKFQVAKINSDAQIVHSLYKYMRKFRAMRIRRIGEKDFYPFSFVYYIFCKKIYFFSNGVMDG
jgi:hypothetical protein